MLSCLATLDLAGLVEYLASGAARRPQQLAGFIERVKSEGRRIDDNAWEFEDVFRQKVVARRPLGRSYGSWLSVQCLERPRHVPCWFSAPKNRRATDCPVHWFRSVASYVHLLICVLFHSFVCVSMY